MQGKEENHCSNQNILFPALPTLHFFFNCKLWLHPYGPKLPFTVNYNDQCAPFNIPLTDFVNAALLESTPIYEQNEIVNSFPEVDKYHNQNYVYFCIFTFNMKDSYLKEDNCLIHHCHQHYAKLLMIYDKWISACHVNFPFCVNHVNVPFLSLASFH